jgi:hypothetical protein
MLQDFAIPILPSRNLAETIEFYSQMGFEHTLYPADAYAIVWYETIEIHFTFMPELVPEQCHAACYVRLTQIEPLFEQWSRLHLPSQGIPRLSQLESKPWGMREFSIVDPSGNLLRVGQII